MNLPSLKPPSATGYCADRTRVPSSGYLARDHRRLYRSEPNWITCYGVGPGSADKDPRSQGYPGRGSLLLSAEQLTGEPGCRDRYGPLQSAVRRSRRHGRRSGPRVAGGAARLRGPSRLSGPDMSRRPAQSPGVITAGGGAPTSCVCAPPLAGQTLGLEKHGETPGCLTGRTSTGGRLSQTAPRGRGVTSAPVPRCEPVQGYSRETPASPSVPPPPPVKPAQVLPPRAPRDLGSVARAAGPPPSTSRPARGYGPSMGRPPAASGATTESRLTPNTARRGPRCYSAAPIGSAAVRRRIGTSGPMPRLAGRTTLDQSRRPRLLMTD